MRKQRRSTAMMTWTLAGTTVLATGFLVVPAATAAPETDAALAFAPEANFSDEPSAEELQRPERADYWAARTARANRRAEARGEPAPAAAISAPAPGGGSGSGGGGSGGGGGGGPAPAPAGEQVPSDEELAALRDCESSGDYSIATGNGYYGAYQFLPSTWWSLGYGGYPHDAPPHVQDQAVRDLYARSGWQPWPGCARALGWL